MNLVIVEDNELVLYQLLRLIADRPLIQVVGMATTEQDAINVIGETRPDVVMLDLILAKGSGLNVPTRLRQTGGQVRVLVLTNYTDAAIRQACAELGVTGFFDKSADVERCLTALENPDEPGKYQKVRDGGASA